MSVGEDRIYVSADGKLQGVRGGGRFAHGDWDAVVASVARWAKNVWAMVVLNLSPWKDL